MKRSTLCLLVVISSAEWCFGQETFLFSSSASATSTGAIEHFLAVPPVLDGISDIANPESLSADERPPGTFAFMNPTAPTRLGALDGPYAGLGIWAQMLFGETPSSLSPVGAPAEHFPDNYPEKVLGQVWGGLIVLPGACKTRGYAQMLAWDGRVWGTELTGVPSDQLGSTDIVPIQLECYGPGPSIPQFTQPAIVPPIPEPSIWMLSLVGGVWLILVQFWRARGACRSG